MDVEDIPKEMMDMEDIPKEMIVNWDHIGMNYVPVSSWTMAKEGSKRVEIGGLTDKQQLTLVLAGSMIGDFWPQYMVVVRRDVSPFRKIGILCLLPITGQTRQPQKVTYPRSWFRILKENELTQSCPRTSCIGDI